MQISWHYDGNQPIRVKTFLKQKRVSRRLLAAVRSDGGKLLINGNEGRKIDKMVNGDLLAINLPFEKISSFLVPSFVPISILYEDRDYLVVDKPAGVASIPSALHREDSLVARVLGYYQIRNYQGIGPHIATRLDRDTSGIVLFAKHRYAHAMIDEQLKTHQIKKNLLCDITRKYGGQTFANKPANWQVARFASEENGCRKRKRCKY